MTNSPHRISAVELEQKVEHIESVLHAYQPGYSHNDGVEIAISDLLADLMHYCSQDAVDFNTCLERAQGHYNDERRW